MSIKKWKFGRKTRQDWDCNQPSEEPGRPKERDLSPLKSENTSGFTSLHLCVHSLEKVFG